MMRFPFKLAAAAVTMLVSSAIAFAQSQNPACQRLEAQLASLDRGNDDPARADQIRRAEDTVNRQQFEIDRLVLQARRAGCESSGFFSIFSSAPHQCGGINRQIDAQRNNLERMQNALEQLQGGTTERAARRQSLLVALGDNGCGPQYRSAALAGQQGGFFDRLFGGNNSIPGSSGPMGGAFRTICVRTCDGYYFPISYEASPDRFRDDEQTCQHMCPAAEVSLYTYHNPGEDVAQAVSLNGRLYTELPTAFQYRKALNPACSCRRPGESWAEALRAVGPDATLAPGDVVVTDKKAKQLSQPRGGPNLKGSIQQENSATKPAEKSMVDAPGDPDPTKRKVRTVGPSFLPKQ